MEVIAAFFFVFMVFAFAVVFALILGYASRAHSAEAKANKLQGALDELRRAYESMREIAREAIQVAANRTATVIDLPRRPSDAVTTYTPQTVAYCPRCNVSVRYPPEAYPVPCPACQTLIDPILDNPPEIS